ncbi:hypothetical protein B0H63DRAFT_530324 [Podospora didyma]|uniref:Uncharacterized protein n=1 Tax=Podospora didyma TaxID=330526 RepID=A0AAE0P4H0_9PEZI|nr:hypothetical protein B0H63DRAFT_530324 [Podospora didyma]
MASYCARLSGRRMTTARTTRIGYCRAALTTSFLLGWEEEDEQTLYRSFKLWKSWSDNLDFADFYLKKFPKVVTSIDDLDTQDARRVRMVRDVAMRWGWDILFAQFYGSWYGEDVSSPNRGPIAAGAMTFLDGAPPRGIRDLSDFGSYWHFREHLGEIEQLITAVHDIAGNPVDAAAAYRRIFSTLTLMRNKPSEWPANTAFGLNKSGAGTLYAELFKRACTPQSSDCDASPNVEFSPGLGAISWRTMRFLFLPFKIASSISFVRTAKSCIGFKWRTTWYLSTIRTFFYKRS